MNSNYISGVRLSATIGQSSYLCDLPAIRQLIKLGELTFTQPVTFLVGENGTGKSTLLEAIAISSGFNAEGGTRNFNFSTTATHSELHKHITVIKRSHPKDGFFYVRKAFII